MLEKLPESIGHALINQRAGMESVVYNKLHAQRVVTRLDVRSRAFVFNARLPPQYTADGEGISPPLAWDDIPGDADSIALIVEDADSPTPHPLVHAIAVGLAPADAALQTGALDGGDDAPADAPDDTQLGRNSYLQHGWLPPDPPPGHGKHRYAFQVFALGGDEPVPDAPGRDALIAVLEARAIASGMIIGTYERHDTTVSSSEAAVDAVPQGATPA